MISKDQSVLQKLLSAGDLYLQYMFTCSKFTVLPYQRKAFDRTLNNALCTVHIELAGVFRIN
jgi:hypothetical protein